MNSREAFAYEKFLDDAEIVEEEKDIIEKCWTAACQYKGKIHQKEIGRLGAERNEYKAYFEQYRDAFVDLEDENERLEARIAELEAQRVPEVMTLNEASTKPGIGLGGMDCYVAGWNDCRKAMLSAAPPAPKETDQ